MSPEEVQEMIMETLHVLYDLRAVLDNGTLVGIGMADDLDELIDRLEERVDV